MVEAIELTHGCRLVSSRSIDDVTVGLDQRLPDAIPDEHEISLLFHHLHNFKIRTGLYINHDPPLAIVGCSVHRLHYRREVPAPVLGHHEVGLHRNLVLQQLPILRRNPFWKSILQLSIPFEYFSRPVN